MKVIVCAGGTGGHIYPAVAIINKIKEKNPSCKILYIGTTDRMEKDIIPKLGIDYKGIEMKGINRKNIFKNIEVLIDYRKAIKKAHSIIKDFQPDIVIGVGGYITAPVISAAHKLKVKTLIHEQNSIPGVTNRISARYVDRICISLPGSKEYFPKDKVVYTGNPRSEEIIKAKALSKKHFGLDKEKKLVVIVMGSLGSTTMMNKIKKLIPAFEGKNYQVLIISGNNYYDQYKGEHLPSNVKVVPFLNEFINLLKSTDIVISRAGASTISEITAIGVPAILVPSPYVTNNHQYKNAKELEDLGACLLVEEDKFDEDIIIRSIDNLFNNKEKYLSMKRNSKKIGIADSATRIYNEIDQLVRAKKNE